jgi:hypothetical protein
MSNVSEGLSKVPVLPEVLKPIGTAFNWVYENLEKPFAAIITSPFSPNIEWKTGESWLEHQKREYDEWDAPTYVKGAAEFAMPLWWIPWFGWAGKGLSALGKGAKYTRALSSLNKSGKLMTVAEQGLPKSNLLDDVLFNSGRLTKAMEKIPLVNKAIKLVGGEGAFITRKEASRISTTLGKGEKLSRADQLINTKMEIVKSGFIHSMKDGVKTLYLPRLQVIEAEANGLSKLLGMDSKGFISNIVDKSGKSQHIYDVLENAAREKLSVKAGKTVTPNYEYLTKEAENYVDNLADVLDDVYKLAKSEGIKKPKEIFLHRIVKGKYQGEEGLDYIKSEFGSNFELKRSHQLAKDAVEQVNRVDYGLDITESVAATIDYYMNSIARKRFTDAIKPMGKTAKNMWDATIEGSELNGLLAETKLFPESTVKNEARISELTIKKKEYMRHLQGHQILEGDKAKFMLVPEFGARIFPREIVKSAEKSLNDMGSKWLESVANVAGTSRMLTAAMDLSAPFIQGAAVFGRNPVAWAKSTIKMLEFFVKPENYYKYLTSPEMKALRQERVLAGGSSQTFEYFKALEPLQRLIGKMPGVGGIGQKAIQKTYGRAETAFTGFGEVARNYLWQGMRESAISKAGDKGLMDLARTVDRMTGVMSTEAIGIGKSQQSFENAFVFFAPRYTRAGLSVIGDALKGGMTGTEARKALAGMAGGGLTMYYGVCKATGQQPNLDPSSARFMTVKIGDSYVGVGGIMTSIMRTLYDIGVTAAEDPANLIKPLSDGKINRWDNPFIKFMYSRTSPITSALYSGIVEQANYFGEPFESVYDWGNFVVDKVTPIATQEGTEFIFEKLKGNDMAKAPELTSVAAEFGGLRRFPKSQWELIDEERDKISIKQYGQPYENLKDREKNVINKNEIVQKLQALIDESIVTRGDATDKAFLNREREVKAARQIYEDTLWKYQAKYDAGELTGREFREAMQKASYGLGVTYEHIDSQPEYASVQEVFNNPRDLKDKTRYEIAKSEYYRITDVDSLDKYGLFDYDKFNKAITEFRQKWGEDIWADLMADKKARNETLPPLAKEYEAAKVIMKPYWDLESQLIARLGENAMEYPKVQSLLTKLRRQLRIANPEINYYYNLFYKS